MVVTLVGAGHLGLMGQLGTWGSWGTCSVLSANSEQVSKCQVPKGYARVRALA